MNAMVLEKIGAPLEWKELADRKPGPGEIRVKVAACGVCRTDLHVVDGELPEPRAPIIPGHEIVGRIEALGAGTKYPLNQANQALADLRAGRFEGAEVPEP